MSASPRETYERPHRPPRPEGAPAADRRSGIREAALRLFAAQGYRSTTMTDIGAAVGIRGPSLYKHVASKHELLAEIMIGTMEQLIADNTAAVAGTDDVREQLRRSVEAHIRYHARHRLEAFVGNREIGSLEEPDQDRVLARRSDYERRFRELIERGMAERAFGVQSARIASYSILDMGIGVASWFREGGEFTVDQLAYQYGDIALRIVGVRTPDVSGDDQ
ncbi:TetR/AcrR family transcriptional regulator [Streptomyces sp. NPDC055059]|uniref:TetR/AcrR family transcriptional regulator n=1 Tax=Streptomyces sp. NBC_00119 TaxID=2975659 RepID=A0AAU1U3L2_9ACTN|nr:MULTISPECIES: TetR/AcrR family transcriptional regulator [unclassified Streptomyces]MCX4641302.1 TetR/AcrR family transcriptional regulator [Streptomyces sp. NBC_01446]MCX5322281.1 TetR/AcrR family transcriptional regulator [Streptomyces sp. NBC_00120]